MTVDREIARIIEDKLDYIISQCQKLDTISDTEHSEARMALKEVEHPLGEPGGE